jgi:dihydrolipoamide dehydrogenase
MAMNETEGMLKLFVSPDGLVLGCHAYGTHSADIVQEVSVLMCKHTTIAELADMVHIHPTLSEILKTAVD